MSDPAVIERYGRTFQASLKPTDLDIELACFKDTRMKRLGDTTRLEHFRHITYALRSTSLDWNPNAEKIAAEICENRYTILTGHASAGKTNVTGAYCHDFWMCSPHDSAVIVTSTTIPGLRRRILGDVFGFWENAHHPTVKDKNGRPLPLQLPGNLVRSENALQLKKGDFKHGIFGFATDDNNVEKSVGKIKGFHPRRLLVVIDEMTGTGQAVVNACMNLESGTEEFQFIGIGNSGARLDPHGQMAEPQDGWDSVTVDDERWPIKRRDGYCLHLDGHKSPNIVAGETIYPYLLTQEQVDNYRIEGGGEENSLEYWSNVRGFWPPEDVSNTVLSEAMILKFGARDKPVWKAHKTPCASLDPAFEGGDKRILTLGYFGEDTQGKIVLGIDHQIHVPINARSQDPIHFQIAHYVIDFCKANSVLPQHFGLDTTGEGGGVAAIIVKEWSQLIHHCEFGGSPSDMPISPDIDRPAKDECSYRVDELWFAVRYLVQGRRLFGLPGDAITQFCSRRYELVGNKKRLETKKDMKARIRRSPDNADSVVILCDMLRKLGIFSKYSQGSHGEDPIEQQALVHAEAYAEDNAFAEEW